jgi:recombinational DNA repair protein RecT
MENKININGIKEQLSQKATPENIRVETLNIADNPAVDPKVEQPTEQKLVQEPKKNTPNPETSKNSNVSNNKEVETKNILDFIEPFIKDKERKDYLLKVYEFYLNSEQIAICTTNSKIDTFIHLATQGLDPLTDEVYLIPIYKNNLYILNYYYSYKGLKNQAFRSGIVKQLETNCVFQGDIFSVSICPPSIQHTPNFLGKRDEVNLICAYSIITYVDDTISVEVMSKSELEQLRAMNPSSKAWLNYSTMAQVKVLKRHLSKLPKVQSYDFTDTEVDVTI